jgi:hypothetical protein
MTASIVFCDERITHQQIYLKKLSLVPVKSLEILHDGLIVHLKQIGQINDVEICVVFPSQRYLLPKVQGFVEFLAKSFLEDLPKASQNREN